MGSWIRLNSGWDKERRHRRVGAFGRMALRAAVQLSKDRDWKCGERRGWVPRAEFDEEEAARHLELLEDEAFGRLLGRSVLLDELRKGIEACQEERLLVPDGNDGWWIDQWSAYVLDPTARERQQRTRDRKKSARGTGSSRSVTPRHSDAPVGPQTREVELRGTHAKNTVTVGHGRHSDKPAQPRTEEHEKRPPEERHGGHRESRYGRTDVRPSPEEESYGLTPPPEPEADGAAPATLDRVAAPPAAHHDHPPPDLKRLELELFGLDVHPTDSRRLEARFLRARPRHDAAWAAEAEELLRRPHVTVGHGRHSDKPEQAPKEMAIG